MIKDPEIRKGLLVSIITSLLVLIFIDPLLKIVSNWIMSIGSNAALSWTNGIYESAALGLREKFSFLILALSSAIFSGMVAGLLTGQLLAKSRRTKSISGKMSKWLFIGNIVFGIISLVSCILALASNFAELQLVASFNQRVTVVAAKANDQQVKELRADWALMKTRQDYEAINQKLKLMAKTYSSALPPPLWD